jgi:hypothetical protein
MRSVGTSIGFDLPVRTTTQLTTEVAGMLARLEEELDSRGATSQRLLAVAFEGDDIQVTLRADPLGAGYPDLSAVFEGIARTCADDRIALHQLRRIAFCKEAISLELVNGQGRPQLYLYPVHSASFDA